VIESIECSGNTSCFPKIMFILGIPNDESKYIPYLGESKSPPDASPSDSTQSDLAQSDLAQHDSSPSTTDYKTTSQKSMTETVVIISLIIGALLSPLALWVYIPYPTPQIEDFFRDHHTGAIKLTIDLQSDSELYSLLKKALCQATGKGLESISQEPITPENKLENKPIEISEEDYEENLLCANLIISSGNTNDEVEFHIMSQRGATKLPQLSWDLTTMKVDKSSVKELGSARLMNLGRKVPTEKSPQIMETWFRGNYLIGNIGPSMEQTIETICSDSISTNSGNTYLLKNWPYDSDSPLIAVIENKDDSLSRLAKSLLRHLNYTFENQESHKAAVIESNENSNKDENKKFSPKTNKCTAHQEEEMRNNNISAYIESISSSLNAIEGISFEAFYNRNDNIELPLTCKFKSNSDIEGIQRDINDFISKVSESTGNSLKIWEQMLSEREYVANIEINLADCSESKDNKPYSHGDSDYNNLPEYMMTQCKNPFAGSVLTASNTGESSHDIQNSNVANTVAERYVPSIVTTTSRGSSSRRRFSNYGSSTKRSSGSSSGSVGQVSGTKATRRRYVSSGSSITYRKTYRQSSTGSVSTASG
jgi:hypothetical protein